MGRYFRVDPIDILNSTYSEWRIRVAAYEYTVELEVKARSEEISRAKRKK